MWNGSTKRKRMTNKVPTIHVIGAGLAGSEACFYLLKKGFHVVLHERRPSVNDGAHETDLFGELVCSNSLKSKRIDNACGLLKEEMARLGSIMMEVAPTCEVPSGNALSVDRDLFASRITAKLLSFPNLEVVREEVDTLPEGIVILATGPLTSGKIMNYLGEVVGKKSLSFFDASAPIVRKDSIDFEKAYYKSRYEQDDASYINCPFTKEEYFTFVNELVNAKKALLHEFDTKYFEGCLPVEVIASRGIETLRHGPLKPFGLYRGEGYPKPYAVLQLRQDNALGDYYNLVGFQTNLTYPEQKRVFSLIPGLEHAEFLRYGLMHRNSYLDAPSALNPDLSLKNEPRIFIAGQLSGVEGYVESAAMGIVAAVEAERRALGKPRVDVPRDTMLGSLLNYLSSASSANFAPMNANWAIYPGANKHNHEECASIALESILRYKEAIHE